jgi:hypothetical protein
LSVTAYDDQLIGLLWLLHLDRKAGNNSLGDMDVQLIVSRDGRTWNRVADRSVFLKPTPGAWDSGRVFPGTTLVRHGDRILIYYTGTNTRHGEAWGEPAIGIASLPADRFVGFRPDSAEQSGVLETTRLQTDGDELIINADVVEGQLQVELLDSSGQVISGFSRSDCHIATRDPLRSVVTWGYGTEERHFCDRPDPFAAIRFRISAGALYAFQVQ